MYKGALMLSFTIDTLARAFFIYTSWYGFSAFFWMMLN
jgi:hypothetical protein